MSILDKVVAAVTPPKRMNKGPKRVPRLAARPRMPIGCLSCSIIICK